VKVFVLLAQRRHRIWFLIAAETTTCIICTGSKIRQDLSAEVAAANAKEIMGYVAIVQSLITPIFFVYIYVTVVTPDCKHC